MNNTRKLGGFLALAGLIVVVGNYQSGAPVFSIEMMSDNPNTRGAPVPYIVSWAAGFVFLVFGTLLLLDIIPEGWSLRRLLLS